MGRKTLFPGRGELDMLMRIFEKRGTPSEEVWKDVSAIPSYVEFSHHPALPMAQVLPNASSVACDFVESLLSLDPKRRPCADATLWHSFFTTAQPMACEPCLLPFVGRLVP